MVEVRLTQPQWEQLERILLATREVETKCFLLCKALEREDDVALLVRELVSVPDDAYERRSAVQIIVRREFIHQLLVRCAEENLSLLEAHTHPWSTSASFSGIDMNSDIRKFLATQSMSPPFRHATMVFGGDMSFEGHLWDYRRRRMVPIDRVKVCGLSLQFRYPSGAALPPLAQSQREIFDRQIRAFGEVGQHVMQSLTVGIVGLGGLGSQIAQALSLLGVGHLILVDPDKLETSNANRVVCINRQHVIKQFPKVNAIALMLKQLCMKPPKVTPIKAVVTDPNAWQALLWADVIVGAVDSATARQFLNCVSVCSLIPYLDGGVGVKAHDGRIQSGGGQVRVVLPGVGFCLTCLGQETVERVEEQLTPEQRELSQRLGYIQGERIPNPQIVFLNGVLANLLVWELVKLVTGCLPVKPYIYYDLTEQKVFPVPDAQRRENCLMCSLDGWLAMGDEVIQDFARTPFSPTNIPPPARRI
jgi:molybdopterin-synthase adenylyltransferase